METLRGVSVAILVDAGFEFVEPVEPRKALQKAGAKTKIVSRQGPTDRSWNFTDWGEALSVDIALDAARPQDFDALLLPGGMMNPDALRIQPKAVAFVKAFFAADNPVAVICHGPWILIETRAVHRRRMTSRPSLKTDLQNAGTHRVDEEVVVDGNLVSRRQHDDIPTFNREMLELFSRVPRPTIPSA